MKRTPMKRKTKLVSKTKPKVKKRTTADFARVYGSKARVEWMRAQPCVACGQGPCETAHTKSGGVGRKADYHDTVPLCVSCHRLQHAKGWGSLGLPVSKLPYLAYVTQFRWAQTQPAKADESQP